MSIRLSRPRPQKPLSLSETQTLQKNLTKDCIAIYKQSMNQVQLSGKSALLSKEAKILLKNTLNSFDLSTYSNPASSEEIESLFLEYFRQKALFVAQKAKEMAINIKNMPQYRLHK